MWVDTWRLWPFIVSAARPEEDDESYDKNNTTGHANDYTGNGTAAESVRLLLLPVER